MKTNRFLTTAIIAVATIFTLSCDNNGSKDGIEMCGGVEYRTSDFYCVVGELVGKCKGKDYYPAYQICNNGPLSSMTISTVSAAAAPGGVPLSTIAAELTTGA
jgi:hypothetical protein